MADSPPQATGPTTGPPPFVPFAEAVEGFAGVGDWLVRALDGPLKSPFTPPRLLPKDRVTFDPQPLSAGETRFSVVVDATRMPGVTYRGTVVVTPDDGRTASGSVGITVRVR